MIEFSKRVILSAAAAWVMALALTGCGGDVKDGAGAASPASTTATVGVDGGTVNGPDGVQVVIPAGALDKPTVIGIARSAVGAPTTLPEDYPATAATPIYEFTPHDVVFNKPVTIRIATSSNAPNAQIFMASPGEEWQASDARISSGFAEWQRNSFSWGFFPFVCSPVNIAPYSSSNPDPYPCSIPSGYVSASATPTAAITKVTTGVLDTFLGSAGSWTVNQASIVRLTINYQAAPDCQNPRVKLIRRSPTPQGTLGPKQTLSDGPVSLTPTNLTNPYAFGGGTYVRGVGSASYEVAFSHLDNGMTAFGYTFSCNRPNRPTHTGGDSLTFVASIPVPTVTYTVGGTVSGLTGTGLVLQNNGGDNLAVAANGAISFATLVGGGAPYAVSVLTQPVGQSCSVANGAGTANANVANVAVSCAVAGAKAWQGAGLLETLDVGEALEPRIAFDTQGNAMASWYQVSSIGGNYKPYARRYSPGAGWGAVAQIPTDPLWNNAYSTPQIAFAPSGNAVAVFSGCTPDGCAIWSAQFTAATATWATATELIAGAGNSPEAQIASDAAGNALVVWQERSGISSRILAVRFEAGTSTWGAARVLSADLGGFDPKIAFDASGNAIAIWAMRDTANAAGYKLMSDRYVAGSGWHPQGLPTTIATLGDGGLYSLAVGAAGSAMAVWNQYVGTTLSLYSSRYVAGAWAAPSLDGTKTNMAGSYSVSVAMDGNGNAIVVWDEIDSGDVVSSWARRFVAGVGGAAVRIDDLTVGRFPRIAMDAAGNAMAVWEKGSSAWANRYVAGTGWAGPMLIDDTNGGRSSSPEVAVDGNGNAIAVWTKSSGLTSVNIWANVFR